LIRAQFGSFEEARERIRHWEQYYNHKRPHQGIGGLCPADRYFEIQAELRKTIEQGITENVLEMALRGKPREPFYMVGRMEGQSVVLRAEKGKLRLMVDDEEGRVQEKVYEVNRGGNRDCSIEMNRKGETDGKNREAKGREAGDRGEKGAEEHGTYGRREVSCGVIGLDGEAPCRGDLSGDGDRVGAVESVAESGDGGDAPGSEACDGSGQRSSAASPTCGTIGEEEAAGIDERIGEAFGPDAEKPGQGRGDEREPIGEKDLRNFRENIHGARQETCPRASAGDSPGAKWSHNGKARGEAPGGIAQDVLRVGGASASGDGKRLGESGIGKTGYESRSREGGTLNQGEGVGERTLSRSEDDRSEGDAFGL
jgi:hypothetical protein